MLDLAIAVVVGGAFGKIVSSLVADVVMPLISFILSNFNFSTWKIVLKPEVVDLEGKVLKAEIVLRLGNFIQNIFDFLIIALSVFMFIKIINKLKKSLSEEIVLKKGSDKNESQDLSSRLE